MKEVKHVAFGPWTGAPSRLIRSGPRIPSGSLKSEVVRVVCEPLTITAMTVAFCTQLLWDVELCHLLPFLRTLHLHVLKENGFEFIQIPVHVTFPLAEVRSKVILLEFYRNKARAIDHGAISSMKCPRLPRSFSTDSALNP
jgi:hypothetical protein